MTNTKKIWQRPEMTVLVRSNPEEAVLQICKRAGQQDGPFEEGEPVSKCNQSDGGGRCSETQQT